MVFFRLHFRELLPNISNNRSGIKCNTCVVPTQMSHKGLERKETHFHLKDIKDTPTQDS